MQGTGGCTKLHEELHNLCSSRNFIGVIKSRRVRWVGHVALMEINVYTILVENLKEKDYLEDLNGDGSNVLEKYDLRM